MIVGGFYVRAVMFQRHVLVDEALRSLARRPKSRLFNVN